MHPTNQRSVLFLGTNYDLRTGTVLHANHVRTGTNAIGQEAPHTCAESLHLPVCADISRRPRGMNNTTRRRLQQPVDWTLMIGLRTTCAVRCCCAPPPLSMRGSPAEASREVPSEWLDALPSSGRSRGIPYQLVLHLLIQPRRSQAVGVAIVVPASHR